MKLDLVKLSRIQDSVGNQTSTVAKRIKDSLEDTESTEQAKEVVREAIESGDDPAEVAEAVVDVLATAIDLLQEQVDKEPKTPKVPTGDACKKRLSKLKSKIKDELDNTETTEEAVQVALSNLAGESPELVLQAVTEVLAETVDALESKSKNSLDNVDEMTDEEIEDSFKALRTARLERAKIRDSKKNQSKK